MCVLLRGFSFRNKVRRYAKGGVIKGVTAIEKVWDFFTGHFISGSPSIHSPLLRDSWTDSRQIYGSLKMNPFLVRSVGVVALHITYDRTLLDLCTLLYSSWPLKLTEESEMSEMQ